MEVILRLIVLKDFFKWSFQKEEPASSLAGRLLLDEVEGGIITRYQILEHPDEHDRDCKRSRTTSSSLDTLRVCWREIAASMLRTRS